LALREQANNADFDKAFCVKPASSFFDGTGPAKAVPAYSMVLKHRNPGPRPIWPFVFSVAIVLEICHANSPARGSYTPNGRWETSQWGSARAIGMRRGLELEKQRRRFAVPLATEEFFCRSSQNASASGCAPNNHPGFWPRAKKSFPLPRPLRVSITLTDRCPRSRPTSQRPLGDKASAPRVRTDDGFFRRRSLRFFA